MAVFDRGQSLSAQCATGVAAHHNVPTIVRPRRRQSTCASGHGWLGGRGDGRDASGALCGWERWRRRPAAVDMGTHVACPSAATCRRGGGAAGRPGGVLAAWAPVAGCRAGLAPCQGLGSFTPGSLPVRVWEPSTRALRHANGMQMAAMYTRASYCFGQVVVAWQRLARARRTGILRARSSFRDRQAVEIRNA